VSGEHWKLGFLCHVLQSGIFLDRHKGKGTPNQIIAMKAFLCIVLASAGIGTAAAQAPLPTSGPSFSSKDTVTADVISVASMQVYPTGIDRLSTRKDPEVIEESIPEPQVITVQGPIRDWSNPPGYMGTTRPPVTMVRHKPFAGRKYHRIKPNRCYTF
jgi:hypothetical protein